MSEFYLDQKLKSFSNDDIGSKMENGMPLLDNDQSSINEEVRTIFVSGLPMDTKQRELYLLFRNFKGFQTATLKPPGKNGKPTAPVGFVTFQTRNQAEDAIEKLEGVRFDPESEQLIRLDFARTNTKMIKNKMIPNHIYNPGLQQQISANIDPSFLSPDINFVLGYDGRITFLAQSAFGPFGPAFVPLGGNFRTSTCPFTSMALAPNGALINNSGVKVTGSTLCNTSVPGPQTLPQYLGPQAGLVGENLTQIIMHPNQNGYLYAQPFTLGINGITTPPSEPQYNLATWTSINE